MKATEIIKQYAKEEGTIVRSTSDLSPFEEWLIVKLLKSLESRKYQQHLPDCSIKHPMHEGVVKCTCGLKELIS